MHGRAPIKLQLQVQATGLGPELWFAHPWSKLWILTRTWYGPKTALSHVWFLDQAFPTPNWSIQKEMVIMAAFMPKVYDSTVNPSMFWPSCKLGFSSQWLLYKHCWKFAVEQLLWEGDSRKLYNMRQTQGKIIFYLLLVSGHTGNFVSAQGFC